MTFNYKKEEEEIKVCHKFLFFLYILEMQFYCN